MHTFPGRDLLTDESGRSLWDPDFDADVEFVDYLNTDRRVLQYKSRHEFSMLYTDEDVWFKFASKRVTIDSVFF